MLLDALGLSFVVVVSEVEELREGDPRELVERNALAKANAVAAQAEPGSFVLACDTEVVIDGRALGQPEGAEDAAEHLRALSGRSHEVLGGVALLGPEPDRARTGVEASTVTFRDLDERLIGAYVASGEWEGRAGGYAIQGLGSALVASVEGDLANVIGLPVDLLLRLAPELLDG